MVVTGTDAIHDYTFDEGPTEGTHAYAILVCVYTALGGFSIGYDEGVAGSVPYMRSYVNDFCVGWHDQTMDECTTVTSDPPQRWVDFTLWYTMTYYIGAMVGALVSGWVADKFGRRVVIFAGAMLFFVGACWVTFCPAQAHGQLLTARFIQSLGAGGLSFSLPLYGAEVSPKELRGFLSGFIQMDLTVGVLVGYIVIQEIEDHGHGWRTVNAVGMAVPVVVMLGIYFVPESPRWACLYKDPEVAYEALKRLRQTDNVDHEFEVIANQIELEGEPVGYKQLLEPSILKRVVIAMLLQVLQLATGINAVLTYGISSFIQVVEFSTISVVAIFIVYTVSTIPAMYWVDSCGRRKLLFIGTVGMVIGNLASAITSTAGCEDRWWGTYCTDTSYYIMIATTFISVIFFAISWGPVCWIYPAEIFPLNVRSTAVSLSTMVYWLMAVVMHYVIKLYPKLDINGVFFLSSGTCILCGIFVYCLCPETKGILLEDVEALFNKSARTKPTASPYTEAKSPVAAV